MLCKKITLEWFYNICSKNMLKGKKNNKVNFNIIKPKKTLNSNCNNKYLHLKIAIKTNDNMFIIFLLIIFFKNNYYYYLKSQAPKSTDVFILLKEVSHEL